MCGVTTGTLVGSYLWSVTAWPQMCQWVEPGPETAGIRRTSAKLRVNELGHGMVSRMMNNMRGISNSFPWPSPGAPPGPKPSCEGRT